MGFNWNMDDELSNRIAEANDSWEVQNAKRNQDKLKKELTELAELIRLNKKSFAENLRQNIDFPDKYTWHSVGVSLKPPLNCDKIAGYPDVSINTSGRDIPHCQCTIKLVSKPYIPIKRIIHGLGTTSFNVESYIEGSNAKYFKPLPRTKASKEHQKFALDSLQSTFDVLFAEVKELTNKYDLRFFPSIYHSEHASEIEITVIRANIVRDYLKQNREAIQEEQIKNEIRKGMGGTFVRDRSIAEINAAVERAYQRRISTTGEQKEFPVGTFLIIITIAIAVLILL